MMNLIPTFDCIIETILDRDSYDNRILMVGAKENLCAIQRYLFQNINLQKNLWIYTPVSTQDLYDILQGSKTPNQILSNACFVLKEHQGIIQHRCLHVSAEDECFITWNVNLKGPNYTQIFNKRHDQLLTRVSPCNNVVYRNHLFLAEEYLFGETYKLGYNNTVLPVYCGHAYIYKNQDE